MSAAPLFGSRLLAFNLLPSLTLHPSRHAAFGAPAQSVPAACARAWHRHWSADILRRLDLHERPVADAQRPELALALLPPDRLARVARHLGAALCAPRLRRAIDGGEVRQLLSTLGADVLDFARRADAGSPARAGAAQAAGAPLAESVDRLGRAALRAAFQGAGPELALRAELKLQDEPAGAPDDFPDALGLALDVLERIEPTWHSSFPAMH
jgi:type III secretion protein K